MNNLYCKEDTSLSEEEKDVFSSYLREQKLSRNIWDLFQVWVKKSTSTINFIYLKVYSNEDLIGLGLFIKIKPFDLRTSYSRLRKNVFLSKLFFLVSRLGNNCVYMSLRNLITSNITRPFFYKDSGMEDVIMQTILDYLKNEKKADMITILDTSINDRNYEKSGYKKYPSPSEGSFDATRYNDISDYLNEHKNLKKNLKRRKDIVETVVIHGPVSGEKKREIKDCLNCSIDHSRVITPSQSLVEEHIFETEVFNSDKYIYILISVENKIAGFHIFQISGSNMGGVLGGFNRNYSRKNFVYERVMVASLDYAIKNNINRVNYSLIDNYTKLRLVNTLESGGLYFYSRNPLNRLVFKLTSKFNDVYKLYQLEKQHD